MIDLQTLQTHGIDETDAYEGTFISFALADKAKDVSLDYKLFRNKVYGECWKYIQDVDHIDLNHIQHKIDDGSITNALGTFIAYDVKDLKIAVKRIKELALARTMVTALKVACVAIESGSSPYSEVAKLAEIADGVIEAGETTHLSRFMTEAYRDLQLAQEGKCTNFVQTGLRDFDEKIGGLQKDGLIIVAGRPSMGKTAWAASVMRGACKAAPVLMISLEMSGKQMAMRFMAAEYNVDLQSMMQGNLDYEQWRKLAGAVKKLGNSDIYVNEKSGQSVEDVISEGRRFKRSHGDVGCIIIDYLTLLNLPEGDRRDLSVGEVTRRLKLLAKELNCPVILLSQLNRKVDDRNDKRPRMSDLRDSGSIEQDADMIIFPYRDEVYNKTNENEGIAEINVAKNRNGRTGIVVMSWVAQSATFKDLQGEF